MSRNNAATYSPNAVDVLRDGAILAPGEDPDAMIARVLSAVIGVEARFGVSSRSRDAFAEEFRQLMYGRVLTPGTPLLTNAGRLPAALSSCVAVPVDLQRGIDGNFALIEAYYRQNMGSGFDLDESPDPASDVLALNEHAKYLTAEGVYERYIGNMANVSVDHPRVLEFSRVKVGTAVPHLNLSVNVSERFMRCLEAGAAFELRDGTSLPSQRIWEGLADAAWACGDPGLLFLDRFNAHNPTPSLGLYRTTAPCAEVALAPGETCLFGYVNLGVLVTAQERPAFDYERLQRAVRLLTRFLDDAVEVSLGSYPAAVSRGIMGSKRRIGIGVCGFADLLVHLGLPYGSESSRALLREILTTMTYHSKVASMELAADRGSFPAFAISVYRDGQAFLHEKYGPVSGCEVSAEDWARLDSAIAVQGIRNASTTALPPTGRSALLLDASTSIEPWFSLSDRGSTKALVAALEEDLGQGEAVSRAVLAISRHGGCQDVEGLSAQTKRILRTAIEVTPAEHLSVVADASRCVDEGASKTVNLPRDTPPGVVGATFHQAWSLGLKAISVYRDGSVGGQPEQVGRR